MRLSLPRRQGLVVAAGFGLGGCAVAGADALGLGPAASVLLVSAAAAAAWWMGYRLARPLEIQVSELLRAAREVGVEPPAGAGLADAVRTVEQLARYVRMSRESLRAQRDLQAAMIDTSPFGVLLTDGEGRILGFSNTVRTHLPVVPQPVGRLLTEAVPFPPLHELLRRALTAPDRGQVEATASSGRFDLLLRGRALPETGGAMLVIADVTGLRQAERARSDFVANVSHELRTPITSVRGYAETLLADAEQLDPMHVELLEIIERNARRMSDLVDGLLYLSRIEASSTEELELEEVALDELCDEVLLFHRDDAALKEIRLDLESDGGVRGVVNREAFVHILGNLVTNAIKYTPAGGRVRVRVRSEGGRGVVDVDDNGRGIAPGQQARVFERFYRVDKGRSRTEGGTGLGLAIVKHLCRVTGAEISLRSLPGRGSTFTVKFTPLSPPPPPRPGSPDASAP